MGSSHRKTYYETGSSRQSRQHRAVCTLVAKQGAMGREVTVREVTVREVAVRGCGNGGWEGEEGARGNGKGAAEGEGEREKGCRGEIKQRRQWGHFREELRRA